MSINVISVYLYFPVIRIKLRHQHDKPVTSKICTPLFTKYIIRCSTDKLHLAVILMRTVAIQLSFENIKCNIDISLNTTKFYLLSSFTNFSNYSYMFRPFFNGHHQVYIISF
jgi:hypothetical protein